MNIIDTVEAADLATSQGFPITARTLERYRQNGRGPVHLKLGSAPNAPARYRPSDVLEWVQAQIIEVQTAA